MQRHHSFPAALDGTSRASPRALVSLLLTWHDRRLSPHPSRRGRRGSLAQRDDSTPLARRMGNQARAARTRRRHHRWERRHDQTVRDRARVLIGLTLGLVGLAGLSAPSAAIGWTVAVILVNLIGWRVIR